MDAARSDLAAAPSDPAAARPAHRAAGSRWERLALLLTAVPVLAAVVSLLVGLHREYSIISDMATEELHVRELGHHPVQVGPFSRFGWFHPGPAIYYLNWPVYQLTGHSSQTFAITALLVNGVCVIAIALLVRRYLGTAAMIWALLVLGVYLRVLGGSFLRDGWNPYLPVLPFALTTMLLWAWLQGSRWALPVAAVLASFAVQSHVGYAPPVAVVGSLALVAKAVLVLQTRRRAAVAPLPSEGGPADSSPRSPDAPPRPAAAAEAAGTGRTGGPAVATLEAPSAPAPANGPRGDGGRRDRTRAGTGPKVGLGVVLPAAVGVLAVVVMWLPPLVEQLSGHPGNLTALVRYFRSAHGDWSYGQGVRQLSNAIGAFPAYVTGQAPAHVFPYPPQIPGWAGAVAAVAAVVGIVLAARARAFAVLGLLAFAVVVGAVGIVSVHQVVGPLFDYLVKWLVAAGLLLWIGVGCAVIAVVREAPALRERWARLQEQRPAVPRLGLGAVALVLVVLTGANTAGAVNADASQMDTDHVVAPLAGAINTYMAGHRSDLVRLDFAPTTRPVLVGTPFVGAGLLLATQKKGLDVRAIPFWRVPFGVHLTSDQDRVKWVVVLAFNDGSSPPPGPGQRVIATAGEYQLYAGPLLPGA
jgi:hypothetical protein